MVTDGRTDGKWEDTVLMEWYSMYVLCLLRMDLQPGGGKPHTTDGFQFTALWRLGAGGVKVSERLDTM